MAKYLNTNKQRGFGLLNKLNLDVRKGKSIIVSDLLREFHNAYKPGGN